MHPVHDIMLILAAHRIVRLLYHLIRAYQKYLLVRAVGLTCAPYLWWFYIVCAPGARYSRFSKFNWVKKIITYTEYAQDYLLGGIAKHGESFRIRELI